MTLPVDVGCDAPPLWVDSRYQVITAAALSLRGSGELAERAVQKIFDTADRVVGGVGTRDPAGIGADVLVGQDGVGRLSDLRRRGRRGP